MSTPFRNVLSEALSDYIVMEDLEVRLRFLFQQPIQVRVRCEGSPHPFPAVRLTLFWVESEWQICF